MSSTGHTVAQSPGVTIRLVGDSGDGMQLLGKQLANMLALAGNDVATFPDFPSEIRAPRGTRAGVSGFQVRFSASDIHTPGDRLDVLIALNPAALVSGVQDLKPGGTLIVDRDSFTDQDLRLANLETSPLRGDKLAAYHLFQVPMTEQTRAAVNGLGLSVKMADRCRNFFVWGLVCWLFQRDLRFPLRVIQQRFGNRPDIAQANERALRAGWDYGETHQAVIGRYHVGAAEQAPGVYRNIMGNQALAWGLLAAAQRSGKQLFLGSYPITPASEILHELSQQQHFGVHTFQAEDEIAAVCSAIGAAFGGALAATTTSSPGMTLKSEGIGLAVMLELPLLIVNVQRGGPSTGMPTKTEQSDLWQAAFGRNGESPLPVLAARSPADCFDLVQEAWRIAVRYMTPVVLLSDGYIANGSEPWRIPGPQDLSPVRIEHPGPGTDGRSFLPYERDACLSRPWALPGTPGLTHRLGSTEKEHRTGTVSHDGDNHDFMVRLRVEKIDRVARDIPPQELLGSCPGDLLVLSWGGTYGACVTAVQECQRKGLSVSHAHLRYLHPFPVNLGEILGSFRRVLVAEWNLGQLRWMLAARYHVQAAGFHLVKGKPFSVGELVTRMEQELASLDGEP